MRQCLVISILILMLLGIPLSFAQSEGGNFRINKSAIDNGGGASSGGVFAVTGTIGQPDASMQALVGSVFQVNGGFWASGEPTTPVDDEIFSDSFEGP